MYVNDTAVFANGKAKAVNIFLIVSKAAQFFIQLLRRIPVPRLYNTSGQSGVINGDLESPRGRICCVRIPQFVFAGQVNISITKKTRNTGH